MRPTQSIEYILNQAASALYVIRLLDGEEADYPFFSALIHYHHQYNTERDINRYQFSKIFRFDYLWQPLLTESHLPSPFEFPPTTLESLMNTLELQAARMLTQAAVKTNHQIRIQVPVRKEKSLLHKILLTTDHNVQATLSIGQQLSALITIEKATKPIKFEAQSIFEILSLTKASQNFLNYLMGIQAPTRASRPFEESIFSDVKPADANKSANQQLSQSLQRHYTNALLSQNDQILEDRQLLKSQITETNQLYAQLLTAYASIRCSVPFPTTKLDQLLHQCEEQNLYYWIAYLLSYGHIVRAFDESFSFQGENQRFLRAHRSYKELSDLVGITRVFHSRASLFSKHNKHRNAIKLLEMSRNIRAFLQEPFGVAKVYNGMAFSYLQIDNLEQTLSCHRQAEHYLIECQQFDELAFTYHQISWAYLLKGDYEQSVLFGRKTLDIMKTQGISTLSFRTRPDLHAMLGLSLFLADKFDEALEQSNYCEAHSIDSSPTGEIIRALLRGLINDRRNDKHLANISFNYVPQLIAENTEIDIHIELLYMKLMMNRLPVETDQWKIDNLKQNAISMCRIHGLKATLEWFKN